MAFVQQEDKYRDKNKRKINMRRLANNHFYLCSCIEECQSKSPDFYLARVNYCAAITAPMFGMQL